MRTDVGLHMNLVSSLVIPCEVMTCSVLHPLRNCEYGLFKECLWFSEASNRLLERSCERRSGDWNLYYLCEMLDGSTIFLEVLGTGIAEESCRTRSFVCTEARIFDLFSKVLEKPQWTWPIREVSTLRTPLEKSGTSDTIERAKDPGAIRSNPRATTHSAAPYFTRLLDW